MIQAPDYLKEEIFSLKPDSAKLLSSKHAPKILILHGSLRVKSFSRLLAQEAGRILTQMGAEVSVESKNLKLT